MAAELYEASDNLKDIARELIEKNHGHLVEADIKYLFRTGNWEVKKRETWGQAKKAGKELKLLTGHDFIITVHQDVWDQLSDKEKRALLDHELQHCSAGTDDAGNKVWYIQGHDVEDFYAIIRRHGLWSKSLRKMENLLNQTELEFQEADQKEELIGIPGGPELAELPGRPTLQIVGSAPKQLEAPEEDEAEETDFIDIEVIESNDTGTEG